jgi:hypothetical protein
LATDDLDRSDLDEVPRRGCGPVNSLIRPDELDDIHFRFGLDAPFATPTDKDEYPGLWLVLTARGERFVCRVESDPGTMER